MGDAINACTYTADCGYHVGSPIYFSDAGGTCTTVQFTIYKWNGSCYCTYVTMVTTDGGSWTPATAETFLVTGPAGTGDCVAAFIYIGVGAFLPIELVSFSGKYSEGEIILNWSTASETNNNYFTVERGIDGINFDSVGTVKGAGNSNTTLHYSFMDTRPETVPPGDGALYYRLKQTDFDGQSEYFQPIAVRAAPLNDWNFIVQNTGAEKKMTATLFLPIPADILIDIVDLQGRKIKEEKRAADEGSTRIEMGLQDVQSGIYFVRVSNSSNSITRKFIVP